MTISPPAKEFFEGVDLNFVYDDKIRAMLTPEGFNEVVQYIYQKSLDYEHQCYEEAETIFENFYGYRRYEDYNSYKSSYHQIKTREKKKNTEPERLPMFPDYWPKGHELDEGHDD